MLQSTGSSYNHRLLDTCSFYKDEVQTIGVGFGCSLVAALDLPVEDAELSPRAKNKAKNWKILQQLTVECELGRPTATVT